jgi:hypothetical protein
VGDLLAVYSEGNGEILRNPRGQHKDMEELVKAEVLGIPTWFFQGIEDRTHRI